MTDRPQDPDSNDATGPDEQTGAAPSPAAPPVGKPLARFVPISGDDELSKAKNASRNTFLRRMSWAVIVIILAISVTQGPTLFEREDSAASATAPDSAAATPLAQPGESTPVVDPAAGPPATSPLSSGYGWGWLVFFPAYLLPYLTCLAGVFLFIMGLARQKGPDWDWEKYHGEHYYRVAQAFAYLLVVWWAYTAAIGETVTGTLLRPNILGFLVGLFILRVERAMDGLGEKFEELLFAILPRAAGYRLVEERRRSQVRATYRLADIDAQWETLRGQISDQGAKDTFDEALRIANSVASGSDPDTAREAIQELSRVFEDVKATAGDVVIPVEELLGFGLGGAPR